MLLSTLYRLYDNRLLTGKKMNIRDRREIIVDAVKNRLTSRIRKKYHHYLFLSFIALYFPHFLKYICIELTNKVCYPNEDFVALKYGLLVLVPAMMFL